MNRWLLLLALACGPAQAQNVGAPSLHDPADSRDTYGRAWYSQQISYEAAFERGTTLNAEARESLAQYLDGARRLFKTDSVCASHEAEVVDREARRLAYLRWWLGLQAVRLVAAKRSGYSSTAADTMQGQTVIRLWLEPCSP
ncbi:hypothetical protein [Roseateles sp.]|uniref:hypothetical protein n=1 Tax=Roseateles sp. TaxID=1971397 RepID=UPI003265CB4F